MEVRRRLPPGAGGESRGGGYEWPQGEPMSARLIAAVVAASLAVPAVALAEEQHFVSITKVRMGASFLNGTWTLQVTGKLEGEGNGTPRTHTYDANVSNLELCYRLAMFAMTKPGRYHFEASAQASDETEFLFGCAIAATTP
jgi:hypothetical protein